MKQLLRFWHNNNLSIVLFTIFFAALVGMSIAGWRSANAENESHQQPTQTYTEYIQSGDFVEGVFENWESEFLQMWALVVLTIWLRQKGADDSKPLRGKTAQDTTSRYSLLRAHTWHERKKALGHVVYSHSLGAALLAIFFMSFALHAVGGARMYNQEAAGHGQKESLSAFQYTQTSQFWYESLQNWQSEFFAVASLLILSIKLRERSSPESKPVGKKYDHATGS